MQENEQQQQNWGGHKCHGGMCCGGMNGCGGHHMGFHILRWVLGIIIILMVFSFGVQIGEFKSAFESGQYGSRGMMRYNYGYQQPVQMMSGVVGAPVTVQGATVVK
jgi:hypothetical protein